ncbi:MAG: pentapeptide repeat-containing protein [Symploca sp. SIO2C1]|nr:pentapeptide repeat-containing protein [Symploca sp. SIO2C1]
MLNNSQLSFDADGNGLDPIVIQQAQELIYDFFINTVNQSPSETVLLEFKALFIDGEELVNSNVVQALGKIIVNQEEQVFVNTIKRTCYILINNWSSKRNYQAIQTLIESLGESINHQPKLAQNLNLLRSWLKNFINSEDYQEIKLFASAYNTRNYGYWSHRFTSYLLVPQYLNTSNPIEQRELARKTVKQIKERFNFDLAMYTVRCDSPSLEEESRKEKYINPTGIEEDGLINLIKQIVAKNLLFSYTNYANIFIQQTKNINYNDFKQNLQKYLVFSIKNENIIEVFNTSLSQKLEELYQSYDQEKLSVDLLIRTCRRVIEFLLTEDNHEPSQLFILLANQNSPLDIVIPLLKIILICKYVRNHLDACLAQLIRYYENYPEDECQWFINFLEVFNIVFAIYTENVQYSLVKVKDANPDNKKIIDFDSYRIFPQLKGVDLQDADLSGADIRGTNLSDADLRGANLSSANLSDANLSLAKLKRANLSNAILNSTKLTVAHLQNADLSGASLWDADLRRAQLHQVNFSGASLIAAQLSNTNLRQANLRNANLKSANLSRSNLRETILRHADLRGAKFTNACLSKADLSKVNLTDADLSQTELQGANLKGANLNGAQLSGANLSRANLNSANLSRADLSGANLSNTDLSYTLLRHVNLTDADLRNANLVGANLFNTNIEQAKLDGARILRHSGISEKRLLALQQHGAIIQEQVFQV